MEQILRNQNDILKVQAELMNILPELTKKRFKCEIKEYHEKRSGNANAYFHLLVNKIAEKLRISNDECKKNLNLRYGTIAVRDNGEQVLIKLPADVDISQFYNYARLITQKEEKGLKCSYYVLYKQTSKLNSKEMARLIDGTISEAKELEIETKTPAELALLEGYEK